MDQVLIVALGYFLESAPAQQAACGSEGVPLYYPLHDDLWALFTSRSTRMWIFLQKLATLRVLFFFLLFFFFAIKSVPGWTESSLGRSAISGAPLIYRPSFGFPQKHTGAICCTKRRAVLTYPFIDLFLSAV